MMQLPRASRPGSGGAALLALLLSAPLYGCMVNSQCQADFDCSGDERCDLQSGQCVVECRGDEDCLIDGQDLGKRCLDHRCQFLFGDRVKAPNFCLEVANPAAEGYGQDLCLNDLQGKVVLIYFGLLG